MSALLDEIIAMRKAKAIEYEEYLKQIAVLAKKVAAGQEPDTPKQINTPGRRALYNNLKSGGTDEAPAAYGHANTDDVLELTVRIDETIKQVRPDDWRGILAKEQVIKAALYGILQDKTEVERIFFIITQHKEY